MHTNSSQDQVLCLDNDVLFHIWIQKTWIFTYSNLIDEETHWSGGRKRQRGYRYYIIIVKLSVCIQSKDELKGAVYVSGPGLDRHRQPIKVAAWPTATPRPFSESQFILRSVPFSFSEPNSEMKQPSRAGIDLTRQPRVTSDQPRPFFPLSATLFHMYFYYVRIRTYDTHFPCDA